MKKNVFITGGTKGIGRAVAICFAQSGADLLLTYHHDDEAAVETAEVIGQRYGVRVDLLKADIGSAESIARIDAFLTERSMSVDALVLNAGLTYREPFETMELSEWERMFFANVHFPVFLLQRLLGKINKGGCVVFTGSLMGREPHAASLSYAMTKASVHAMTRNLVKFLAPYDVRVNAVAPGFVDTEWQKNKPQEIRRRIEDKIALGRFCAPEELADVYKLLVENPYMNGEVVYVDGGYSYK